MSMKTDEKGRRKEVRVFDIGSNAHSRDWRRLKNAIEAVKIFSKGRAYGRRMMIEVHDTWSHECEILTTSPRRNHKRTPNFRKTVYGLPYSGP
jgi:hypothetical protein